MMILARTSSRLPSKTHQVYGYDFDGFWEDIGTIRSFYETNLALPSKIRPSILIDAGCPIYSSPAFSARDPDIEEQLPEDTAHR